MQSVRNASVDWIRTHIIELWPDEQQPGEVAESLVAIAAEQDIPVEQVIEWLHEQQGNGFELSSARFSRARQSHAF